jgi:hypothetical protein
MRPHYGSNVALSPPSPGHFTGRVLRDSRSYAGPCAARCPIGGSSCGPPVVVPPPGPRRRSSCGTGALGEALGVAVMTDILVGNHPGRPSSSRPKAASTLSSCPPGCAPVTHRAFFGHRRSTMASATPGARSASSPGRRGTRRRSRAGVGSPRPSSPDVTALGARRRSPRSGEQSTTTRSGRGRRRGIAPRAAVVRARC